jgi:hypothetical protein
MVIYSNVDACNPGCGRLFVSSSASTRARFQHRLGRALNTNLAYRERHLEDTSQTSCILSHILVNIGDVILEDEDAISTRPKMLLVWVG